MSKEIQQRFTVLADQREQRLTRIRQVQENYRLQQLLSDTENRICAINPYIKFEAILPSSFLASENSKAKVHTRRLTESEYEAIMKENTEETDLNSQASSEQNKKIEAKRLYIESHLSLEKIAQELDLAYHEVYNTIHDAGIETRKPKEVKSKTLSFFHKKYPEYQNLSLEEILKKLYEEDKKSIETIAYECNLSKMTVSRWLASFGISARTSPPSKIDGREQEVKNSILQMHKNGLTHEQIAKEMKISYTTLYRYFKRLGINLQRKQGRPKNFF